MDEFLTIIAMTMVLAGSPSVQTGHAAHYGEGVMENVVAIRQANQGWEYSLPVYNPGIVGYVAIEDCDRVGQRVAVWHETEGLKGPYLIADCANRLEGHDRDMRRRGIIIEVDYNTAMRWGTVGLSPEDVWAVVIEWNALNSAAQTTWAARGGGGDQVQN